MNGPDKPRLTEKQKKQNHIDSEKKRREAIREGFDHIANIVPGMKGQGRSESVVLQATVQHTRSLMSRKDELRALAMEKGISQQEFDKEYEDVRKKKRGSDAQAGASYAGTPAKEASPNPKQSPS